jgi:hypothetical protein
VQKLTLCTDFPQDCFHFEKQVRQSGQRASPHDARMAKQQAERSKITHKAIFFAPTLATYYNNM